MEKKRLKVAAWTWLLVLMLAGPCYAAEDVNGEVFSLGEVIVSGEDQVVNLATTVNEVTAEDIKQRGAQTVAEALTLLPGLYVAMGGKDQSFVNIRGFDQSDVKLLIDGVPVYEQYFRTLDLSQIPTDFIAKITVTKGASSVLYGPNTLGGVINIITKKAGSKPSASATAAWGDYNTQEYSVSVGAPIDDFNFWLGYSYRDSDGYRLSDDFEPDAKFYGENNFLEDGGKRDDSAYIKRTFNTKVGWDPAKNTSLYLTFDYQNNVKGIPDRVWTFTDWEQYNINLVGQVQIAEWLRLKSRVFYVDHDDTIEDTDLAFTGTRHFFLKSAYDNYSVGGDVQSFMDFGKWSFLKVGLSFVRDNCEQTEVPLSGGGWVDAGEFESDTYSIGVEDEIRPLDWFAITVGASYDYYDPRKADDPRNPNDGDVPSSIDVFNPQMGVVVDVSENTQLHGSVGKKTRFPHLQELYSSVAGGNPDLDPQKTIAYEIGVTQVFSDNITGTLAYFYNDIEDLIERITIPGTRDRIYVNIGEARTQGVEATLGVDITDNFWAGFNYTYLSTKNKDTGNELEARPRHRANIDLRYRFPFGLTTAMQASYTQRQYYEDFDGNWKRGPDYFLLNARAEQILGSLYNVQGRVFIEVQNITDKFYHESEHLAPGRNFLAGLNFTY
ncbi:MAG: TonB-dependent receptor [Syntrophotaleaceae bacterium]